MRVCVRGSVRRRACSRGRRARICDSGRGRSAAERTRSADTGWRRATTTTGGARVLLLLLVGVLLPLLGRVLAVVLASGVIDLVILLCETKKGASVPGRGKSNTHVPTHLKNEFDQLGCDFQVGVVEADHDKCLEDGSSQASATVAQRRTAE